MNSRILNSTAGQTLHNHTKRIRIHSTGNLSLSSFFFEHRFRHSDRPDVFFWITCTGALISRARTIYWILIRRTWLREKRCLIRIVSDARTAATINRFHEQVDVVSEATNSFPRLLFSLLLSSFVALSLSTGLMDVLGQFDPHRYRKMSCTPLQHSALNSFND